MEILTIRNVSSMRGYQDLEDASNGKVPMSEIVSDIAPEGSPSEPIAISHESWDSSKRIPSHDGERARSQVLSMPHSRAQSRAQSVRTASPALSQGKVAVVDESSESDASHHARREFCLS